MIAVALFTLAGVLCILTSLRREQTVPQDGALRPNRSIVLLVIATVCATIPAVVAAVLYMISVLW